MTSEKQFPQLPAIPGAAGDHNLFQPFRCPECGSHRIEEDESYYYECGRRYVDDHWAFCLDCDWTEKEESVFGPLDEDDDIPF